MWREGVRRNLHVHYMLWLESFYKFVRQREEHYHDVMNPAHLDDVNEIYTCTDVSARGVKDTLSFYAQNVGKSRIVDAR